MRHVSSAIRAIEQVISALDDAGIEKDAARQFIGCMTAAPVAAAALGPALKRMVTKLEALENPSKTTVLDLVMAQHFPEEVSDGQA